MKKIILMFIMLIISMISVSGIDTWEQYQYDSDNTGVYGGSYEGLFNDGVESFSYKFKGYPSQPLYVDITNDSIPEYITISGNDFIFYNVTEQNQLQIQYQVSTGWNSNIYKMIYYDNKIILLSNNAVTSGSTFISIYEWINNTLIRTQYKSKYDSRMISGLTCLYINSLIGDYCYYFTSRRSGTGQQAIIRYNISGNNIDYNEDAQIPTGFHNHILIADLKNDGDKYIYSDAKKDLSGFPYAVVKISTNSLSVSSSILPLYSIITGLSVHDVDGGFDELVISYYLTSGTKDAHLSIRNYALSEMYHITMQDNPDIVNIDVDCSNVLYADFYGDTNKEFCGMYHITRPDQYDFVSIICAVPGDSYGTLKFSASESGAELFYFNPSIPIISAKMREDINDKYSIITGSAIFWVDEFNIISFDADDRYGINGLNNNYPIITDINNDNLIDICSSSSGQTFCAFNSFENQNAFYIGSFGATTPRADNQGESNTVIYKDICLNSTHTFFTAECTDEENYRCNYVNDIRSDLERLSLTCPDGTSIITDFVNNKINFSCNFTTLGTYKFPVFIQDNHHENDLLEFKNIKVNVVNGTEFIDCNFAYNIYDTLPLNETETIQEDAGGSEDIPTGNTAIGDYCVENSDCISGKCENHICAYRLFNEPCLNDAMCLSGKCVNGFCNKPSISQLMNQARVDNFGDDEDSDIIIGMIISIGGMLAIILVLHNIVGCIVGAIYYFVTSTTLVFLSWLPPFIFFINLFIGVVAIIIYFSFKGE